MEEISWGYGFNMPTGCFARGKWRCNGVGCILFWTSQWPIVKEEWQFLLLTLLTSFGFSAKDGLFQQDNSLFNCVWMTKIIPLRLGWLPNIYLPSNSPDLSPIKNKKCCSKFPAVISDKHYSVIIRPACIDIQAQRFHHLANFLPHRVAARYSGEGKGYVLFFFLLQFISCAFGESSAICLIKKNSSSINRNVFAVRRKLETDVLFICNNAVIKSLNCVWQLKNTFVHVFCLADFSSAAKYSKLCQLTMVGELNASLFLKFCRYSYT